MRSCLVGLPLIAVCVTAQSAKGQQGGAEPPAWSVGLARGFSRGSSGEGLGFEHNRQSASLLFEWRRPKNRFGVRLELLRGIQDHTWRIADQQPGCSPVSCFQQSEQTTSAAFLGASYEFRQGRRLRPYVLFGGGVQSTELSSRTSFTCAELPFSSCSAMEGAPREFTLRDFRPVLNGAAGVSLNLGRFSAFAETRLIMSPTGAPIGGSHQPFSVGLRIHPDN